jgi:O-antigen/teichoic acid export membrane protein
VRTRSLGWVAISQALNALTNVAVTLQLARVLPSRQFAGVALAFTLAQLGVAALRGYSLEPAVVHGDLSRTSCVASFRDGLAVATAICGVGALLMIGTGISASVAIVVVTGFLGLLLQDVARWLLFGMRLPARAAAIDALWAGLQGACLVGFPATAMSAAAGWTVGATGSALAGGVLVLKVARRIPSPTRTLRVWQWGMEYAVAAGALPVGVVAAAATGGVEIAGGLRGAMAILGAATVLLGGAHQLIASRLRYAAGGPALWGLGLRLGGVLGLLVAALCAPLMLVPDSQGRWLLGETWPAVRSVLPILILQKVAAAVGTGPVFVLRKVSGHTAGLWWRVGVTAITVIAVAVFAPLFGLVGAAWALAGGTALGVPVWLGLLRRASQCRAHAPSSGSDASILTNVQREPSP